MTVPLTRKQAALLDFIGSCDRCPSFDEMRVACGLKSKSGVHRLIEALEERGFIRRLKNRARAIEIANREPPTAIPFAGSLKAIKTDDLIVELRSRGFVVSIPLRAA